MALEDEIKAAQKQIVDGQQEIVKELRVMNTNLAKLARTAQLLAEHIANQGANDRGDST